MAASLPFTLSQEPSALLLNWILCVVIHAGAVAVSCSLAAGLSQFVKKATLSPAMRATLAKVLLFFHRPGSTMWSSEREYVSMQFVPFTAVAAAGIVNVFLMRKNEMTYAS